MTGRTGDAYTATEGEVEITRSTPERVEGRFRFRGVRACTGAPSHMVCRPVSPPDSAAPTVEVEGTFVALPHRGPTGLIPLP